MIFGLLFGCQYFKKNTEGQVVARIYDKFLYFKDIPPALYKDKSPADSLNAVHQYIENWAYQTFLLQEARKNVDTLQINRLVQKYREDLLTETYKNLLLQKYIDTIIPADTLQAYYPAYNYYFKAPKDMVAVKYLVMLKNNSKSKTIKKWFFSQKPEWQDSLIKNMHAFEKMDLSGKKWFDIERLRKDFPVFKRIPSKYILKKSKKFVLTDSLRLYLVFVNDLVMQNETLPLDLVQNDLKQLILSKRKQQGLERLEKEIKQEALKRKDFKIYKTAVKNEP